MSDSLQKQRAAAFGVYLHIGPTASALPFLAAQLGRPFSLETAIESLREADGPESARLQRQAVSALVRGQVPHRDFDRGDYFHTVARQALGAYRTEQFEQLKAKKASSSVPQRRRGEDLHRDDHLLLDAVLQGQQQQARHVEIRNHKANVLFDPHSFVTKAIVSAEVNRSVESFAVQSDPRNWSKVAPTAFLQSYRVAEDSAREPVLDASGNYVEAPASPPLGQNWKGFLFEEVAFTFDEIDAALFRNVLDITFQVLPASTEPDKRAKLAMRFSLYRSVSSEVGLIPFAGGLNVDSGFFTATELEDGWCRIVGEKCVRFRSLTPDGSEFVEPFYTDQFLNLMAPALVGLFMDEFIFNGATFVPES